jgi:hypothetical protein
MLSNKKGANRVVASKGCLPNGQSLADTRNVDARRTRQVRLKHKFVNVIMTGQKPPLLHNKRFHVSDEDIIHYSEIFALGHNPTHMKGF